MHSDQRQPGWKVKRPTSLAPTVTTSTLVLSGVRTSSGASMLLASTPAMPTSNRSTVPPRGNNKPMPADVAIVGGGAIGACCALELDRRGACVTLYERGPALASGCSAGNAGLVSPSHSTP